jgi:spermidine/putrescine transport system permease protein
VYLFLPIAVVIAFSFNNPKGRFNYTWDGFTLTNWTHPFGVPGIGNAIRISVEIALLSGAVATTLGALMALALTRYRFRGRGIVNTLVFLPMATPEIVMGSSLLTLFLNRNIATGFVTILIAHIMFNISYVVVTVKARLAGFDRHLEEAAMDLGANGWITFWKVTLPLIAPGVLAAGLLAFALSIDDFVITYFNSGSTITFPLFVWGSARVATPPQINVIGTMIFVVAVGGMLVNLVIQNRRAKNGYT